MENGYMTDMYVVDFTYELHTSITVTRAKTTHENAI